MVSAGVPVGADFLLKASRKSQCITDFGKIEWSRFERRSTALAFLVEGLFGSAKLTCKFPMAWWTAI